MEENRSAFKILTGKRPRGMPRRRWKDNIRIYLTEIDANTKNWVESAKTRDYWRTLVNAALNLRVPQNIAYVNFIRYFLISNYHSLIGMNPSPHIFSPRKYAKGWG